MNSNKILIDGMYNDPSIVKLFLAIGEHLKPNSHKICIQSLSCPKIKEVSNVTFYKFSPFLRGLLLSVFKLPSLYFIILFRKINLEKNLGHIFHHNNIQFSPELFDTLSIKYGIEWKNMSKLKLIYALTLEIAFYYYLIIFFKKEYKNLKFIIVGDSAYRYGYIAKLSGFYKIPIICNFDLNSLTFNYYSNGYLHKIPRYISCADLLNLEKKESNYSQVIEQYFEKRFKGDILQHDVQKAFKNTSLNLDKLNEFLDKKTSKQLIVTVFAHIFSDAPHNIPGLLFEDFKEWFLETTKVLINNKNVKLIIKEHPSAELYKKEKGLVQKLVNEYFKNENCFITDSIPSNILASTSDYIITGSGTVMFESLFLNKNIIIASKKPFEIDKIVYDFKEKKSYLKFLSNLSQENNVALDKNYNNKISNIHFLKFNNRDLYSDFPIEPYIRGIDLKPLSYKTILNYLNSNKNNFSNDLKLLLQNKSERFTPKLWD